MNFLKPTISKIIIAIFVSGFIYAWLTNLFMDMLHYDMFFHAPCPQQVLNSFGNPPCPMVRIDTFTLKDIMFNVAVVFILFAGIYILASLPFFFQKKRKSSRK